MDGYLTLSTTAPKVLLPSAQEVPEHHVEQQNTSEAKLV
ncbi:hypothetical protein J574_1765 [Acinetobacter baumannii 1526966]|nr:hypothetical protein J574_1765 [Acinetobacter baumannii 1526966]